MRALLDVNVLIALHDTQHVHHLRAVEWFAGHAELGWASCPLTQNGCLRIMSQPGYAQPQPVSVIAQMLQRSTGTHYHQFWADDLSLLDTRHFDHFKIHGHRQLTDLYLLALAVKHGGRLVTFDEQIALSAVHGAGQRHLATP